MDDVKTTAAAGYPPWAETLRRRYLAGEAHVFILYGNVFDSIDYGGCHRPVKTFIAETMLGETRETVLTFDAARGLGLASNKAGGRRYDDALGKQGIEAMRYLADRLPLLKNIGLIFHHAAMSFPMSDDGMLSADDRSAIISVLDWASDSALGQNNNIVLILTESLAELNARLVSNPRIGAIEIPLPGAEERAVFIRRLDPTRDEREIARLAQHASGLKLVQIEQILKPKVAAGMSDADREVYIRKILGAVPGAAERARRFTPMTAGMSEAEIRALINPEAHIDDDGERDDLAEIIALLHQRKQELISKDCEGLIEIVTPKVGLEAVGGNEEIKKELRRIADDMRSADVRRCPMGLLMVGAMGTGKTFVTKCFVKDAGLSAVVLKNFRSKWVGSTEANLEKVLRTVKAMGPTALIIDEGDRSFGNSSGGDGDGGTSSRVIARIKEFMSDTENRGQVLFILMTNRPDKLDVDIKRAGRLDIKLPFFYAQTREEVADVMRALFTRHRISAPAGDSEAMTLASERLLGYSNADIEAVVLLAGRMVEDSTLSEAVLTQAVEDFIPSRETAMIRYMDLLAVSEASRKSLLPPKMQTYSAETLAGELAAAKRAALIF